MSTPDSPGSSEPVVLGGRYEVHRRLARGGMADVFLARDSALDRPVAVKVLFPEFAADPAFVERFRREAQAAANLTHPNIVGVYDWGAESGTYYIVMEYVDGQSLAQIIRSAGPLEPRRTAEVAFEVAGGLGFAHHRGVVHRDVKPGNVLVSTQNVAKVTDFGIARAVSSTSEDLTQAGNVMGTATYFSPEQAQGFDVDARSDLYSLGVVMYEILCGRPPFSGDTPVAIAYKHVQENPPPPSTVISDMPPGLEAVILKSLSKRPEDRYLSADDLRADLKRWLAGDPTVAERALVAGAAAAAAGAATVAQSSVDPDATTVAPAVPDPDATTVAPSVDQGSAAPAAVAGAAGVAAGVAAGAGLAAAAGADVAPGDASAGTATGAGAGTAVAAGAAAGASGDTPDGTTPEGAADDGSGKRTGLFVGTALVLLALLAGLAFWLFTSLGDDADNNLIKVPPVVGLAKEEAVLKLKDAGFNPVVIEERTDEATEGVVFDQDPEANTEVEIDSDVEIKVSLGSPLDTVPEGLVGQPYEGVEVLLERAGFVVELVWVDSDEPRGTVIGTDPDAGQDIEQGGTIVLLISNGPQNVDIPDVTGQTVDQARGALASAGFAVGTVSEAPSDIVPAGRVITTDPVGTAPKGSTVDIVASSGPQSVSVPDVVGKTESEATAEVQAKGLKVATATRNLPAGDADDGRVVAQSPGAGTEVDPNSTVTLTIGVAAEAATTTSATTTTSTTSPGP